MNTIRSLLLFAFFLFCGFFTAHPSNRPRLVIFISIDQLRGDHFDRFKGEFTGGFRRLIQEGMHFANADLNYAASETGPGHATLGTGAYPASSGIVSNEWFDRSSGREVYCVEDSLAGPVEGLGGGCSPRNLLVTGLGDWLKSASPRSKVFSLSLKDRAAILMGGKRPDGAFWYNRKSGRFVTSDHYVQRLPAFARDFNSAAWIQTNVPASWERFMPESLYAKYGPDEMEGEGRWHDDSSFPHPFDRRRVQEQIVRSPFADLLLLDFAREAITAERLGQRDVTDLLCIGLSGCDYVGHTFGPNSHEVLDYLLRIDRALGAFLEQIERMIGKNRLVVVVSADHAAQTLPEYARMMGNSRSRRILYPQDLLPKIASVDSALQKELGLRESLVQRNAFLNYGAAAQVGVDSLKLEERIRSALLKINGIEEVYFRRDLTRRENASSYAGKFQRSYYPARGKDIYVRFCEDCLITTSPTGTTHGSPYRYDTHVGLVFWGGGIRPQRITREVHTVDIAPTIAKLLGVPFPGTVDGRPLQEIVH